MPVPEEYAVTVAAGSLHVEAPAARLPHRWTEGGAEVDAAFTGAHLLHLAVAGCVLNDLFREAAALGVPLDGAEVTAGGGFDTATWASTGVVYAVRLSGPSPADAARLLARVDAVAEIPRALHQGVPVRRGADPGVSPPATPRAPRA